MAKKKRKEFSGVTVMNGRGKEVPVEMVRKDHLKRDKIVARIFDEAIILQKRMANHKAKVFNLIGAYQVYWKKFNKAEKVADLNNLTLSSYNNLFRVIVKTNDIIQLDDKIGRAHV